MNKQRAQASTTKIMTSIILLESGKVITVKLTSGTNTTSGSTFSAKNEAGTSTASYTISAGGSAISVGGTVATFNTGTAKQTETLTFSAATGATLAGDHTETLTFTISTD